MSEFEHIESEEQQAAREYYEETFKEGFAEGEANGVTADALWNLLVALGQANLTPEQSAIVGPACDAARAALIASGRGMG